MKCTLCGREGNVIGGYCIDCGQVKAHELEGKADAELANIERELNAHVPTGEKINKDKLWYTTGKTTGSMSIEQIKNSNTLKQMIIVALISMSDIDDENINCAIRDIHKILSTDTESIYGKDIKVIYTKDKDNIKEEIYSNYGHTYIVKR